MTGLRTTGGFLEKVRLSLSPGMTCIIGARGTCKSTIVETIRFAFHHDPDRIAELIQTGPPVGSVSSQSGLITATLRGGTAIVEVEEQAPTGARYEIQREVGSAPRLYRDQVLTQTETDLLHRIEIYSQGDLSRIAVSPSQRLKLLDSPFASQISALQLKQQEVARWLELTGPKLRALRSEWSQIVEKSAQIPYYRQRLAELQKNKPSVSTELEAEHAAYVKRSQTLQNVRTALEAHTQSVRSLQVDEAWAVAIKQALRSLSTEQTQPAATIRQGFEAILHSIESIQTAIASLPDLTAATENLRNEFEQRSSNYYRLRQEQETVSQALRTEQEYSVQLQALLEKDERRKTLETEIHQNLERRRSLRSERRSVTDTIVQLRLTELDSINKAHGERILLTLVPGHNVQAYVEFLNAMLRGSNLRDQLEIAQDLARTVLPEELIELVESGDSDQLATLTGRDNGQMSRLIAYLIDHQDLYRLESVDNEDHLEVTMYIDGVAKPIGTLSKGQMATALLPLLLREAPYPLIIDQPEDDLDNKFIFESLVQTVRKLKTSRQLVFVTHNANIPVLGEADTVVVMGMESPTMARQDAVGTVDEVKGYIVSLLEGGKEAFVERGRRYHLT